MSFIQIFKNEEKMFQQLCILLVLGAPDLDAVLQIGPSWEKSWGGQSPAWWTIQLEASNQEISGEYWRPFLLKMIYKLTGRDTSRNLLPTDKEELIEDVKVYNHFGWGNQEARF